MRKILDMFKKEDHELSEEEKEKLESIVEEDERDGVEKSVKFEDVAKYVESITNIYQINRIRNLLDAKEKYLEDGYSEDMSSGGFSSKERKDEKVVAGDDKENRSKRVDFEVEDVGEVSSSYEDEYLEDVGEGEYGEDIDGEKDKNSKEGNKEEIVDDLEHEEDYESDDVGDESEESAGEFVEVVDVDEDKEKNELRVSDEGFDEKVYEEIVKIFGEENVFYTRENNTNLDVLKDKNILHIGIRKLDAFDEESSVSDENSWFVSNIKNLSVLKEFKMIRSQEGIKDLMCEIDESSAVVISYRSISLLDDREDFDFSF